MGVKLHLEENRLHRDGVPDLVRCAVLLQTDGLLFDVELRFRGRTPVLSMRMWGGKVGMRIGERYLWFRGNGSEELGVEDADSEVFRRWVKENTRNGWAEVEDYET